MPRIGHPLPDGCPERAAGSRTTPAAGLVTEVVPQGARMADGSLKGQSVLLAVRLVREAESGSLREGSRMQEAGYTHSGSADGANPLRAGRGAAEGCRLQRCAVAWLTRARR